MLSLGIDVGELKNKGLHLVLMDDQFILTGKRNVHNVSEVVDYCAANRPDIVAVDSPPAWGLTGKSRLAERELRERGIQSYATPSVDDVAKQVNKFYGWMRVGFTVFEQLVAHYPRYRNGEPKRTAIEVFPHASAVYVVGAHQPEGIGKAKWRRAVLTAAGIKAESLTNGDWVDAGLAALTGIYALRGDFATFGNPEEGVIVVPRKESRSISLRRMIAPTGSGGTTV
jgi:predicted RNase H-like nuclease